MKYLFSHPYWFPLVPIVIAVALSMAYWAIGLGQIVGGVIGRLFPSTEKDAARGDRGWTVSAEAAERSR
jgi:hypothetical protein